jgi:hypothetical protein
MKLKPEARWAARWSVIAGALVGVLVALISETPKDGSLPGISLGLESIWRAQLFLLATPLIAISAFLVLLSLRGLLIVDIFESRQRRRRFP